MGFITSAGGILALLDEDEDQLQTFALERLNELTDNFWPEIADYIQKIEKLEEDVNFGHRQLAALVVSKVYFHLGSYLDSLTYALRAGPMLHMDPNQLYIDTIEVHVIDRYTKLRAGKKKMDLDLENLLEALITKCVSRQEFKHAIGIALQTCRMDWFRRAINASVSEANDFDDDMINCLTYSYKIAMKYIEYRKFRDEILNELVKLYEELSVPDYVNMCQCLIHLDKPREIANMLDKLVKNDSLKTETFDNELMAYQIGFDLYESATQDLLGHVRRGLRLTAPVPSLIKDPVKTAPASGQSGETSSDKDDGSGDVEMAGEEKEKESSNKDADMKEEKKRDDLCDSDKLHQSRIEKLEKILSGEMMIEHHLQFLISNNHTDLLILKHTKDAVRASVCHTATVIANAFMHCGTTSDQFLRDNLDWLSRATNWAKMTATASLGAIHRGHEKEALTLMQAYLPKESNSPGYVESGSLYALGLIHANHGDNIIEYLLSQTRDATSEIVRHGGCLGLGLAAMGTQRTDVYEQLKTCLLHDDAVTGEAAGLAMGLVMLGSANPEAIADMVDHARDTQHEKILRGLSQGIALTMYGQQDQAERLINELGEDKDAILRRAAMYTVAMAYCGTASTPAMKRLLHVAVSDVDNDVRRASVEALGFLLFRCPEQMPSMVSLLSESYNPHVRYGAAMALGIGCSGTGLREALALLEPLTNDSVNFVRQGALIASALILIQQTESTCPKVKDFRQFYAKVISDKHEDSIAKFGAILAQGIIDAGGRNMTISLQSRTGHTNMTAVVGMFVFTQFWYWFPLSHFLSMAFTPTCLIALNSELKMLKMNFISNAKPSTYGYPAPLEEKKREIIEKVTAVLSITAKAKKKDDERKKKEQKDEKMEVDVETKPSTSKEKKDVKKVLFSDEKETKKESKKDEKEQKKDEKDSKKGKDSKKEEKEVKDGNKKEEEKKKDEPNFDTISNPARVMKQQLKVVNIANSSARFSPVKDISIGGIILMRDRSPTIGDQELVQPVPAMGPKTESDLNEPAPPEPFEYIEDEDME